MVPTAHWQLSSGRFRAEGAGFGGALASSPDSATSAMPREAQVTHAGGFRGVSGSLAAYRMLSRVTQAHKVHNEMESQTARGPRGKPRPWDDVHHHSPEARKAHRGVTQGTVPAGLVYARPGRRNMWQSGCLEADRWSKVSAREGVSQGDFVKHY